MPAARDTTTNWGTWPAWLDEATETPACRGKDTDLFFPGQREGWKVPIARAICAVCPLKPTCKAWAIDQPPMQLYGVWGGTTTTERRKLHAGQGGDQPAQFRKTTNR